MSLLGDSLLEHVISENQGFDYVKETDKSSLCLGFHPTGTTLNMYKCITNNMYKHKSENHCMQMQCFLGPTYDEVLWTTLKKY